MEGSKRCLSTTNLPFGLIGKLMIRGYRRVEDLQCVTPAELASELRMTEEAAREVLATALNDVNGGSRPEPLTTVSANALYSESRSAATRIITFSKAVDTMIGGGVRVGQLTEIYGPPGSGKTQLGMQLTLDVQIPSSFSGSDGEAVFIDTEGGLMAERLAEMADAVHKHLDRIAKVKKNEEQQQDVTDLSRDRLLGSVHVFRALDDAELLKVLEQLPAFLQQRKRVRLVVVDSLAFHFRQDRVFQTESNVKRARLVNTVARELNQLAKTAKVAVVVTNQMTTVVDPDPAAPGPGGQIESQLPRTPIAPCLGESWATACATRLYLWTGKDGVRRATLVKSPTYGRKTTAFKINSFGVRDDPSTRANK